MKTPLANKGKQILVQQGKIQVISASVLGLQETSPFAHTGHNFQRGFIYGILIRHLENDSGPVPQGGTLLNPAKLLEPLKSIELHGKLCWGTMWK